MGLRRGELLGFHWAAVDLERGMLIVSATSSGWTAPSRSARPRRRARCGPCRSFWRLCGPTGSGRLRSGRAARERWKDTGLVFTSRIGTPIEPDNLRWSW